MTRWETRVQKAEDSGDDDRLTRALAEFTAAVELVEESAGWQPAWTAEVPPSRQHEFTAEHLVDRDDDDLTTQWNQLHNDPLAQQAIEAEWDRRDAAERAQASAQHAAQRAALVQSAPTLTDDELTQHWNTYADDRDMQEVVEAEWDRRVTTTLPTGDEMQELEWAYANMSPSKYQEVERRILTDPSMWTQQIERTETQHAREERLRQTYHDYQFERYMAAEDHCRGHMLNKRGRRLDIDPYQLMFGNSKQMMAYASDEYKAFIGMSGGHMSFNRFRAERGEDTSKYSAHNVEVFNDVAHV
jgi:hypothetical protein